MGLFTNTQNKLLLTTHILYGKGKEEEEEGMMVLAVVRKRAWQHWR